MRFDHRSPVILAVSGIAFSLSGCESRPSDRDGIVQASPSTIVQPTAISEMKGDHEALSGAARTSKGEPTVFTGVDSLPPGDPAIQVLKYRCWKLANPEPYNVAAKIAAYCRTVSNSEFRDDPHMYRDESKSGTVQFTGAPIRVWVNQLGEDALLRQEHPRFPVGSIIVKEKLIYARTASEGSAKQVLDPPELLTVMIKRDAGFNPAAGDWEFLGMTGDARQVQARGALENCMRCHVPKAKDDYVFRDYLPAARPGRVAENRQ